MQHPDLDEIAAKHVIKAQAARAATLGIAARGRGGWRVYTGAAGNLLDGARADTDTLFDLASVSKPFLAVLCARLVQRGKLEFDTRLGDLLPEAHDTPQSRTSIELLLSHRAGLQAHLRLFAPLEQEKPMRRARALRAAALGMRQECRDRPGQPHPPLYSDLGYILVGAALQQAFGRPLDELISQEIVAPLGIAVGSARQWLKGQRLTQRVAPTECVFFRGGLLRGVVHDDNCWALSGYGAAGHAGLFGNVEAVLSFGAAFLDALDAHDESWLSQPLAAHLVAPRAGGTLRCGFDGKAEIAAAAGEAAGPRTFGHLGFTGTSLWCDPDQGVVTVLLTNRVHPSRENQRIRQVRPLVHDRLFRLGAEAAHSW